MDPNFTYGLASKPRQQEPCMFEILSSYGECLVSQSRTICGSRSIVKEAPNNKALNQTYQNVEPIVSNCCQNPNANPNLTQNKNEEQASDIHEEAYLEHHSPQKSIPQHIEDQLNPHHGPQNHHALKNSTVYPKEVKHELYSYEKCNLKQSRAKSVKVVKEEKNNEKDTVKNLEDLTEAQIQERQKKIKSFKILTRELPNSSFTTYYGKPAFEAYGRGTSCKNLKTHNVMPHRGDNHPQKNQTHYAALLKGRKISTHVNLPRKPLQSCYAKTNTDAIKEQPEQNTVQLPLQKPDLVHSVRFANKNPYEVSKKQRIPPQVTTTTRPKTTKPIKPKNNLTIPQKKSKANKKRNTQNNNNDGLKYLNKRQHLLEQLEEKKTKASQLAYKVTECYPLEWNCSNICKSYTENDHWEAIRPAGKPKEEGIHVSDLFERKVTRPMEDSHVHIQQPQKIL